MSQYNTTISLLDKLIARLEANTGGEPLLQEDTTQPVLPQTLQKQEQRAQIKEQI